MLDVNRGDLVRQVMRKLSLRRCSRCTMLIPKTRTLCKFCEKEVASFIRPPREELDWEIGCVLDCLAVVLDSAKSSTDWYKKARDDIDNAIESLICLARTIDRYIYAQSDKERP